jgi:nucleotide-binding universal stress UspA family protein
MKILIAYDGTLNSKKTLEYGIGKIKVLGGRLIVLHVFNSSIFIGYDSIPDAEDIARKEAHHHIEDAKRIINEFGSGIHIRLIEEEGNPEDEIRRCAVTENVDLILAPPGYKSIIKSSPCPVSIIPGSILVPVDNTDSVMSIMDRIIEEAGAAGSKVIFLGIVPIHLYNRWEKKEIEKIKKETSLMLKKADKTVRDRGIESKEIIRAGYPDEEILKAAGEHQISMIMMAETGESPSELSKAGAIISEGSRTLSSKPLVLVPTAQ